MAANTHHEETCAELRADYISPTSTKAFVHPLPSASASTVSVKEKTAYLSGLRKSVVQLQDDINAFLTTKMEEDKALSSSVSTKGDDKKEEENYGEEGVDED